MAKSNRRRGERREQIRRARQKLTDHQYPEGKQTPPRPWRDEAERQSYVEEQIRQAMAEGAFDNLPGAGKPLDLRRNPYADPGQELAFGLLKQNDLLPEWIAREKEIRQLTAAAREALASAWRRHCAHPDESAWQHALARFEAAMRDINAKIDDFNLIVPILSKQKMRLRLAEEVERAKREGEEV